MTKHRAGAAEGAISFLPGERHFGQWNAAPPTLGLGLPACACPCPLLCPVHPQTSGPPPPRGTTEGPLVQKETPSGEGSPLTLYPSSLVFSSSSEYFSRLLLRCSLSPAPSTCFSFSWEISSCFW